MVAYGIEILPLTKRLKSMYPDVTQPWYSYNAGALVMFNHLDTYFKLLKNYLPTRGYLSNPTKSILVVHTQNLEAGEEFGQRHGFKVCMGARYLGVYIRYEKTKGDWIKYRKDKL